MYDLSTKDTCSSVLFDLRDRDNLSTRDKIIQPMASLVQRFHSTQNTHKL